MEFVTESPNYYYAASLLVFIALCATAFFVGRSARAKKILVPLFFSICIAQTAYGVGKILYIRNIFSNFSDAKLSEASDGEELKPIYHLSQNGKNVLVIFSDRAISSLFPPALEQFPELKKQFEGFTFYPNCLSFGTQTVFGFPPLAAGYEYTQEEMNKRKDELLVDKHNESLLVMPRLFLYAGFAVMFSDPPLLNYDTFRKTSPFSDFPEITVVSEIGKETRRFKKEFGIKDEFAYDVLCRKQIVNFSLLQILSPLFRKSFYRHAFPTYSDTASFYDNLSTLHYLPKLTDFLSEKNVFVFLRNDLPHFPQFLDLRDFTKIVARESVEFDGMEKYGDSLSTYLVNVANLKALGNFFDYLRENDVFDRTRIIVVADHGHVEKFPAFNNFENPEIPSGYNPLLLVKDFYSTGEIKTDASFMTNADTLFLAKGGFLVSDTNPFTGKKLEQKKDDVHVYPPGFYHEWSTGRIINRKEFKLVKENGFHVSENIFLPENWIPLSEWEEKNEVGGE